MVDNNWRREGFTVSTNKQYLDRDVIVSFLTYEAYWAQDSTRESIEKSIENTPICFGIYEGTPQDGKAKLVGFARVITDLVTFAYLADGFVLNEYRGRGLFKWLLEIIVNHPELQGLRRFVLVTKDAHPLYRQFGFRPLADDAKHFMQITSLQLD